MSIQPVTARLVDCDGKPFFLPPLRSWDILRTDGNGCDAVTLCTAPIADAGTLARMCRIEASWNGSRVFTGLVDELSLSQSGSGTALTVYGRGNAARLLDNQVKAMRWKRLTASELAQTVLYPLGIGIVSVPSVSVSDFSVVRGASAMQLLQGFCVHAGLLPPCFNDAGELLLRKTRPAQTGKLPLERLRSAVWRDKRSGVLSRVELVHTRTGMRQIAQYPALIARGGQRVSYGSWSGDGIEARWRSAAQRIAAARQEEYTLELTFDGQLVCDPGYETEISLPQLGVQGRYVIGSVRHVGGAAGCAAVLTLRKE